jgi:hypothetical protein
MLSVLVAWVLAASPVDHMPADAYPTYWRELAMERARQDMARRREEMLRSTVPSGSLPRPEEPGGAH